MSKENKQRSWNSSEELFLKQNQHLSRIELAKHFNTTPKAIKRKEQRLLLPPRRPLIKGNEGKRLVINERVALEHEIFRKDRLHKESEEKLREAYRAINALQAQVSDVLYLEKQSVEPFEIKALSSAGGEATVIAVASDWHIEEKVKKENVNGMNEYNLDISKERASKFFATVLRLIEIEKQNTKVNHLVLALLGDFITNNIHEEIVENNLLNPNEAIKRAEQYILSGIEFLLQKTNVHITVICHSGNHGRTTEKVRIGNEAGHSLEYLMYHFLARSFQGNKRIKFIIPDSYLSYLKVYDTMLCFHHGHAVKYAGGVHCGSLVSITSYSASV